MDITASPEQLKAQAFAAQFQALARSMGIDGFFCTVAMNNPEGTGCGFYSTWSAADPAMTQAVKSGFDQMAASPAPPVAANVIPLVPKAARKKRAR